MPNIKVTYASAKKSHGKEVKEIVATVKKSTSKTKDVPPEKWEWIYEWAQPMLSFAGGRLLPGSRETWVAGEVDWFGMTPKQKAEHEASRAHKMMLIGKPKRGSKGHTVAIAAGFFPKEAMEQEIERHAAREAFEAARAAVVPGAK